MAANPVTASPRIDLYSDTVTRPTPGMRKAISEAEVGNEQAREDPTVNKLCEMVAELLGKEAAIFLPSGTMCNEIAYRVWVDHGEEIVLEENSHALHYETGGPAALSGAMCRTIRGKRGMFTGAELEAVIRVPQGWHGQRQRLVSIENTANLGGGAIWPLEQIEDVAGVARKHGLKLHLDGARLLNAVVASGIPASAYAAPADSAWIDLSKGLGCPVGGVLAGSKEFIEQAWRFKHQFGGAMRQAGIIAAAGVYALENHVERMAEDHANARLLAEGLAGIKGIGINPNEIDTNMVYFTVGGTGLSEQEFARRLRTDHGVRIGPQGKDLMRAVTHLDVSRADIEEAIRACAAVVQG